MLIPLTLMDLHVGDDDITPDKDYKHVFKRLRNALLREKGILVNGIWITPAIIQAHLRDAGHTNSHIHSVFNPEDKQDVTLAYNLLRDIWTLPPEPIDHRAGFLAARKSLKVFGTLCYCLVYPYICVDMPLSEQLEHLSAAAHLTLVLYACNGARAQFIPTSLYIDIMIMIKNVYFCVAKTKADLPNDQFFIVLLGTDRLETLFGILRTMVGNDANLDILQLALRLTGTTDVANILARHPEWDKGPRRLHLPIVARDPAVLPDAADHINPGLWKADTFVKNVSLASCWKNGRRSVEDQQPFSIEILAQIESATHPSVFAPCGAFLFDLPFSEDDLEDHDTQDVLKDAMSPNGEDSMEGI
ncbi:hypothetical protein EWM64_g5674 [Hericium alpestre]|uniref:Uncharacterized protein n=1 Tax=Hericium alpestre TaxID=135208 RepID=A0A4Y9ZXW1_9AGAM|nr:hypothetical protein EWM64_g5674 [Hericium alpestre]